MHICLQNSAYSQTAVWPRDWGSWETASGDWWGYRTWLKNAGIDPELLYVHDLQANPVGGERQSAAYAGGFIGAIDFDLDKLMGLNGTGFSVGFYQGLGRDLSGDDIGNVFDVAEIYLGHLFGLAQLNFYQSLMDERIDFAIGRLSTGSAFATSDAFQYYVSLAVNGNPAQILFNVPSFTSPPYSQWGVQGTVNPQDYFYFSAGAYNADFSAQDNEEQGFNLKFNPEDGVLVIAEAGLRVGQENSGTGLPGRYLLGGYYDTSDYTPFIDAKAVREGNWGLYFIANQKVYEEYAEQGLNLWGVVTLAPQQAINLLPYGVSGGAYYTGLFDGRDKDVSAAAFYIGLFSDDLPGQSYELVFEANHRFQINDWFYTNVDGQYVINPDGRSNISNAWVVGLEMAINF
ncbi:carbohydrate porin [Pseudovibrio axinellae]|uniref:carbohydrate porin n=1 Tax=Pseudovibrio axinellae TaxID=989403 RepID=UPI001AD8CA92|nr:carbohydrate porin [Pseudovibrio axinellae]